jgi:mRNA interferase YafQ
LKKVKYAGRYTVDDLLVIVELLACNQPLPEKHREHNLGGNWKGYKGHIKPDWLLIYQSSFEKLVLARTGSHSELF